MKQRSSNLAGTTACYEYDAATGLVAGLRHRFSPNHDERPPGTEIDVVIIHAISLPPGSFGGDAVERFFCNELDFKAHPYFAEIRHLKVSAHFFIGRSGEVVQFVPATRRAWHAGASMCLGRPRVNDFSVGIELEGSDETGFEWVQYQRLGKLVRTLRRAYPAITRQHLFGHCHIAPQRKTDPGPYFNWRRFQSLL